MHVKNTIRVNIRTLDDIYAECKLQRIDLLKIDVQGYELEVLKGGANALNNTQLVVCEVLFFQHYKNQPMFEDVYLFLKNKGFLMLTMLGWLHDETGRPLQCDAVFVNSNCVEAMKLSSRARSISI